jgi:hypothetical protein
MATMLVPVGIGVGEGETAFLAVVVGATTVISSASSGHSS